MDITNLEFEKQLILTVKGKKVTLTAFKTQEHGNIKLGIDAPRSISVDREEISHLKKEGI